MSEFQMNTAGSVEAVGVAIRPGIDRITAKADQVAGWRTWQDLPEFVCGYIEAMFFTETSTTSKADWFDTDDCTRTIDGCIPADTGFSDIHPDALAAILRDCAQFEKDRADLLSQACDRDGYDMRRAGHDFWYTRNGHGVGFWERNLGDIGDRLTDAAHAMGEANVWFGDHVDHGDAPFVYHQ